MTRKESTPESSTTSPRACRAVKRIWVSVTRSATRRPAPVRAPADPRTRKPKRASAPRRESWRAVERPKPLSGSLTARSRTLHALQPFLGLRVVREDRQRLGEHLDRLVLPALVLIQQGSRVVRQRLRGDLAAHALHGVLG